MENLEEHPASIDGSGGRSAIVDPPDGRIPYQPWAAAKRDTTFERYHDAAQYCLPHGAPRFAYGGTKLLVQTPGYVFMLNDYADTYRIIPTDGRPHVGSGIRLWEGDVRGQWEGNTLVMNVSNQLAMSTIDHVGNFVSEHAKVVERMTMIDKDVIHYAITIGIRRCSRGPGRWRSDGGGTRTPSTRCGNRDAGRACSRP